MQTSICRHLSSMWVAIAILVVGCNSGGSQLAPLDSMQQRGARLDRVIQSAVVASAAHDSHRISPDGIVYTPAHVKIKNSQFNLDLNNDGTTDFVIAESNSNVKSGCYGRGGPFYDEFGILTLAAEGSNGFEVNDGYAAKLIGGSLIGAGQSFSSVKSYIEYREAAYDQHCVFFDGASGDWPPISRGYLGLAFLINGQIHYGWAAMIVKGPRLPVPFLYTTLTGYAYQTKVGKSIVAGQR